MKNKIIQFFSLFGSTATLFCCAIPALLSVIAGGAAISSFVSTFPWIIPLSKHKNLLFIIAGALLLFNGFLTLKPKGVVACTITGGKGCEEAGAFTRAIFFISLTIYIAGLFAAYALVPLIQFI